MVRPINLPDFANLSNKSQSNHDMKRRVERMRGVLRQRYGGRPSLLKVFKNFAATKPGFIFPADIQNVLAQMGVVMSDRECELLIQAVDRSDKGSITFEEFADLVYAPMIEIGRGAQDAIDRHTKLVTSQILEMLVERGPGLGK